MRKYKNTIIRNTKMQKCKKGLTWCCRLILQTNLEDCKMMLKNREAVNKMLVSWKVRVQIKKPFKTFFGFEFH